MATRNQHYVPQVYLKAWETQVETVKEPNKKFQGIYIFSDESRIGEGANKERVLWKPHLYTISFRQMYITPECSKICYYFVKEIYEIMRDNGPQPVYGVYKYSVINTRESIRKHLMNIYDWEFFYEDGNRARTAGIINRINDLKCYIIEDSFCRFFESRWMEIKDNFINGVHSGIPIAVGSSERKISEFAAKDMLEFFFVMLCRSPNFDAMGVYSWMNNLLKSAFSNSKELKEMMDAVWFIELYNMFYGNSGGFYHTVLSQAFDNCQLILFEAYEDAEYFITSDNPAFQHFSQIEIQNTNGYIFSLSPKHLLFIGKGSDDISVVDYRLANLDTVRRFNRIIKNNSNGTIVGIDKNLNNML